MTQTRRNRIPKVLLVLGLVLFAGFAGLTRFPESAVVDRLVDWPLIGPLVAAARAPYLPPPAIADTDPWTPIEPLDLGLSPSELSSDERGPLLGPDNVLAGTDEELDPALLVWLLPGTRVYREPDLGSAVLAGVPSIGRARLVSRRGDWYQIVYRRHHGWAKLSGYDPQGDPPYGSKPTPPGPIAGTGPDREELEAAVEVLGEARRELVFGPYRVHTDVANDQLLDFLDQVAGSVGAAYTQRYGRQPVGPAREHIVIYRSELSYRIVQRRWNRLRGLPAVGHHTRGVASLFVGGRSRDEVAATLIHELVHALNTRAIGPALPPWIDEGLAEDLSYTALGDGGQFQAEGLGGRRLTEPGRTLYLGPMGLLRNLHDQLHEVDPLQVMKLDWQSFVHSEQRSSNYAIAGFWIRYLIQLDGPRVQLFLDRVAAGESVAGDHLLTLLDREPTQLRDGFRTWIEKLVTKYQLVPSSGV